MQISTKFTVAIHILTLIHAQPSGVASSHLIAQSVQTNPVVIRRIEAMLKEAGLIDIKRGSGGGRLCKPAETITLLDVYQAIRPTETIGLFKIHESPNLNCEVGANIENAISETLNQAQQAMEAVLEMVTIATISNRVSHFAALVDR